MSDILSTSIGLCEFQTSIKSTSSNKSASYDGTSKSVRNATAILSPTQPFIAYVRVCASATALAEAFGLEESVVQNEWLLNSDTARKQSKVPLKKSDTSCDQSNFHHWSPCVENQENHSAAVHSPDNHLKFRFSPCNVQDTTNVAETASELSRNHLHNVSSSKPIVAKENVIQLAGADTNQVSLSSIIHGIDTVKIARCQNLALDADRFAPLFGNLNQFDGSDSQFMPEVVRRLLMIQSDISDTSEPQPSDDNGSDEADSAPSSRLPPPNGASSTLTKRCGLSPAQTHRDLILLCDNGAVRKKSTGLYRVAKSQHSIDVKSLHKGIYFETLIVRDGGKGGTCIGLCDQSHSPNSLVGGGKTHSIGLHSSGQIVQEGGKFFSFGNGSYGTGDRVGCVVAPKKSLMHWNSDKTVILKVSFFINDAFHGCTTIHWAPNVPLFAAVSLCNRGSTVAFLCCERDWRLHQSQQFENRIGPVVPFCQAVSSGKNSDHSRHRHRLW